MSASKIKGVITALATPFKNGAVDKKSFVRLLRRQLDEGIDGFVVNGTTGESPTLTREEVRDLFAMAQSEIAGAAPLIVGTGTNSTAGTVELTRDLCKMKPDAVLVVVPYYNRPTQRGLFQHFKTVAENSAAPVLIYDVPSRTAASLTPETVAELSRERNILGIKDATGNVETLRNIKAGVREQFVLLSGDDATCAEYCAGGGAGVISVSSHLIGAEMKGFLKRGKAAAGEYATKYAELMKHLYIEPNPVPLKMALYWMGIFDSPEMRLPLITLDEKFHKDFKTCLKNLGKL